MRHDPIFTLWAVHCPSAEVVSRLRPEVEKLTHCDAIFTDAAETQPMGVVSVNRTPHRVGDNFTGVRILPPTPEEPVTFRILFVRRPEAGRYWKDVMVRTLKTLRDLEPDISTEMKYRGDHLPTEIAALNNA